MTNDQACQYVYDSFVTAFELGNESMIDHYFADDAQCYNHSKPKQFNIQGLKLRLPEIKQQYQNLQSEIKDVVCDGQTIAFHVKQRAFYAPEKKSVTFNIMNLYKLRNDKVIEWRLWVNRSFENTSDPKN